MENKITKTNLKIFFESFSIVDEEGFSLESFGNQNFMTQDFIEATVSFLNNPTFKEHDFIFINKENNN